MIYQDPFNPMPSSSTEDERLRGTERRGGQPYWGIVVLAAVAVALLVLAA